MKAVAVSCHRKEGESHLVYLHESESGLVTKTVAVGHISAHVGVGELELLVIAVGHQVGSAQRPVPGTCPLCVGGFSTHNTAVQ